MASVLDGVIKKSKIKKSIIAEKMGMSYPTFVSKIKKPWTMTYDQAKIFCDIVGISINDYIDLMLSITDGKKGE